VDVCHSHFPLGGVAALAIKAARGAKTALRTVHGDREWEKSWYRWTLRPLYINMLFPILLDVEVGVSQAVVDYLAKHPGSRLFRRNPLLIYNAIPIKASLPLKPTLHPKEEGQILLGSVGRLTTQKGYIYLIQAFPRILQEFAGIKCIIAGEGELRTELEADIHRLGMENFITLLGQRNDICELLNQMDLFVLPSLWEGLPTVALESMAIGTPVLATDVPGTRELIQNEVTGWLVPPQDPDRLALGIIRALKDSELRRRISSDAFAQLEKFSIRAIAMQYISLYSSILRNKPKKGENKGT
jgi:glycosyltransferase involved in cell wall biosynthesis